MTTGTTPKRERHYSAISLEEGEELDAYFYHQLRVLQIAWDVKRKRNPSLPKWMPEPKLREDWLNGRRYAVLEVANP